MPRRKADRICAVGDAWQSDGASLTRDGAQQANGPRRPPELRGVVRRQAAPDPGMKGPLRIVADPEGRVAAPVMAWAWTTMTCSTAVTSVSGSLATASVIASVARPRASSCSRKRCSRSWARAISRSASFRAPMSRAMVEMHISRPSAAWTGDIVMLTSMRLPSFRTLTVSSESTRSLRRNRSSIG